MSRSLLDLLDLKMMKSAVSGTFKANQTLALLTAVQMVEKLETKMHATSILEGLDKMIRAICSMPVRLAVSTGYANVEGVATECARLQAIIQRICEATYGTWCLGDLIAALVPVDPPAQALQLGSVLSKVCDSITDINIVTPYLLAKFKTVNMPFLDFVVSDEEWVKVREAAKAKAEATKVEIRSAMDTIGLLPEMQAVMSKDSTELTAGLRHVVNVFNVA